MDGKLKANGTTRRALNEELKRVEKSSLADSFSLKSIFVACFMGAGPN